jgi:1-deoxy-D-xylulose-5-phosphate reductoisomerase
MSRSVTILGATGSVGQSTLDLVARAADRFEVVALTAHRDVAGLAALARRHRPNLAVIGDASLHGELNAALAGTGIETAAGEGAICDAAASGADWTMAAIVGTAGLKPVMRALEGGGTVALANKEALVSAGVLMIQAAAASGATLLPVDSEHNAIFQCFDRARPESVRRIILTASGGPFRDWSLEQMRTATPDQAVAHPNWSMGAKISVDSATLMNKALEVIEARWLFDLAPEQIRVVIHPQSIIHSMVVCRDGCVLAQLGTPDMRGPISYGLSFPRRIESGAARLDFTALSALTFEAADERRFPGLHLAWAALRAPEGSCTVLNAANEVGVAAFLEQRIGFDAIHALNADTIAAVQPGLGEVATLEDLLALDERARAHARQWVQGRTR